MIKSLLSRKLGELRITRTDLSRATGIRLNTISALYNDALDCDLSEILVWEPNKIKMTNSVKKGKQRV